MRFICLIIIMLAYSPCQAAIYMEQNEHGVTTYSDTPISGGKRISVPNIANTTPSVSQTTTNIDSRTIVEKKAVEDTNNTYSEFTIQSPANNATIQNQINIAVDLHVVPALKNGDKFQLLLDDQLSGQPSNSPHLTLINVSRGEHQVYAVILDKNQKIIMRSNTITIFTHRASSNFKPS